MIHRYVKERPKPVLLRDPRTRRSHRRRHARPQAHGAPRQTARLGRRKPVLHRAEATGPTRLPGGAQSAGKTRERTFYTLTDQGLEALKAWALTPIRFTPLKSEVLVRLLIADLVGERATRDSIATLRDDIADLATRVEQTEAGTTALPHRRKYLLLVTGFLRSLLALHLELVDEVERKLDAR